MPPIPRTRIYPLPPKVRGFCHENPDGSIDIILNSRLTYESNKETCLHELKHIKDFVCKEDCDVPELEELRHKK